MKYIVTLSTGWTKEIESEKWDIFSRARQFDFDSKNGMDMIDAGWNKCDSVELDYQEKDDSGLLTLGKLKKAAKVKGWGLEEPEMKEEYSYMQYIRINYRQYMWATFYYFTSSRHGESCSDKHLRFVESYSQKTGRSVKSFRQGMVVENLIFKSLNQAAC